MRVVLGMFKKEAMECVAEKPVHCGVTRRADGAAVGGLCTR